MLARPLLRLSLLCACATACGGSPTQPAVPTALAISPATDLIRINQTERFTAAASFPNGETKTVVATWSVDRPEVVRISPDGASTGSAPGDVAVVADYQGLRATRSIRVVPDYHGLWVFTLTRKDCGEVGGWVSSSGCHVDENFTTSVTLRQDRVAVSGEIKVYSDIPTIQLQGAIAQDGKLSVGGSVGYTITNCTGCLFEVIDWQVLSRDNQRLSGLFTIRVTAPNVSGHRWWTLEASGVKAVGTIPSALVPGGALLSQLSH